MLLCSCEVASERQELVSDSLFRKDALRRNRKVLIDYFSTPYTFWIHVTALVSTYTTSLSHKIHTNSINCSSLDHVDTFSIFCLNAPALPHRTLWCCSGKKCIKYLNQLNRFPWSISSDILSLSKMVKAQIRESKNI